MPMPAEVINAVNAKALSERKKGGLIVDRSLSFKLGDDEVPDADVAEDAEEGNVEESESVDIAGVEDGAGDVPEEPVMMLPPSEADVLPQEGPTSDKAGGVLRIPVRNHKPFSAVEEQVIGKAAEHAADDEAVSSERHDELPIDEVMPVEMSDEPKEPDKPLTTDETRDDIVETAGVLDTPEKELEKVNESNRYDLRPRRSTWKKYAETFASIALTNYSPKRGTKAFGLEAIISMMKEMLQMHKKKVFHPVHFAGLSKTQLKKTIRSLMFLKRKRDGRLKARFCADGRGQFRNPGFDVSAQTVSIEALFLSLAIDAFEGRDVATVDVEGAFLHAKMPDEVIMEIGPELAEMLADLEPDSYRRFVAPNGKLYVVLDKALYGCIESAKLFYEHISKTLEEFGFVKNPYDVCVFNKMFKGKQITVAIHVDDLKISCVDPEGVNSVIQELERVYTKVNVFRGPVLDYLGMDLDFSTPGVVKIGMKTMIDAMLDELNIEGTVKTPAGNYLFSVSEHGEELGKEDKERFHSVVAKLLYIAKRGRPDILTAVSFLSTRVLAPTKEDEGKLMRVLRYLNGTRDLVLTLGGSEGMVIVAFVDASFAVHVDGKGHTGQMITVGGGAVYIRSSKQKMVAKSSTEAELIAISDGLAMVLWTRNFLEAQGFKMGPATLHQDNKSTIVLAEKGRSVSGRTRHISIRYFFVKDKIDSNEVRVVHTRTEDMVADFFTKPLQGSLFIKHRATVLNMSEGEKVTRVQSSQGCVGGREVK